jgi:hypothetical protein
VSNIARVWLVGREQLVSRLVRLHRYLLLAPLQLVLAGGGCMLLAASSDLANTFDSPRAGGPAIALLLFATLLLAFLLFLLACRSVVPAALRRRRHLLRWLIYPIVLWSLFTAYQTSNIVLHGIATSLSATEVHYGSDDMYYNHYNARLVLQGQNPYVGERLAAALRYFRTTAYTPLARGRFADVLHYPSQAELDAVIRRFLADPSKIPAEVDPSTTHSYPAGAFLVNLPAVWAGVPSIAITQLLLLVLLLVLICRAAPPLWQPIVLVLLLSLADGSRQVAGADFEIWPLALMSMAWIYRDRSWISALLVGAACAVKQTAWLAAPFYFIWVWRRYGLREAGRRVAVSLGVFLAINLPWIVASFHQWLGSLLLPVSLPLLPDGSGVIGLSLVGILPLLPSWIYGLLEVALFLSALWWYWGNWERYPFAGLVLPLLPLLGAWRSSERYFVLLPLVGVLAAALTLAAARGETPVETGATQSVPTGAL